MLHHHKGKPLICLNSAREFSARWNLLFYQKAPLLLQLRPARSDELKYSVDELKGRIRTITQTDLKQHANKFLEDLYKDTMIPWRIFEEQPLNVAEVIGLKLYERGHHSIFLRELQRSWDWLFFHSHESEKKDAPTPFEESLTDTGFSFKLWNKFHPLREYQTVFASQQANPTASSTRLGIRKLEGSKKHAVSRDKESLEKRQLAIEAILKAAPLSYPPKPARRRAVVEVSQRAVDNTSAIITSYRKLSAYATLQRSVGKHRTEKRALIPDKHLVPYCAVLQPDRNYFARKIPREEFIDPQKVGPSKTVGPAVTAYLESTSFAAVIETYQDARLAIESGNTNFLFRMFSIGIDMLFPDIKDGKIVARPLGAFPSVAARYFAVEYPSILLNDIMQSWHSVIKKALDESSKKSEKDQLLSSKTLPPPGNMRNFILSLPLAGFDRERLCFVASLLDEISLRPGHSLRRIASRFYLDFARCIAYRHETVHKRLSSPNAYFASLLLQLFRSVIDHRVALDASSTWIEDQVSEAEFCRMSSDNRFVSVLNLRMADYEQCASQNDLKKSSSVNRGDIFNGWAGWQSWQEKFNEPTFLFEMNPAISSTESSKFSDTDFAWSIYSGLPRD